MTDRSDDFDSLGSFEIIEILSDSEDDQNRPGQTLVSSDPDPIQEISNDVSNAFQYLGQKWNQFKQSLSTAFFNRVALMNSVIPAWTRFLEDYPAYGQFTFARERGYDLAVYLQLGLDLADLTSFGGLKAIEDRIRDTFAPLGLKIDRIQIKLVESRDRWQRYHQRNFKDPLENQRYQLFLLALESRSNWNVYMDVRELDEVRRQIRRYLTTHLEMMLIEAEQKQIELDNDSDNDNESLQSLLDHWQYVIAPWINLGWALDEIKDNCHIAMIKHRKITYYPLIDQLVDYTGEQMNQ